VISGRMITGPCDLLIRKGRWFVLIALSVLHVLSFLLLLLSVGFGTSATV
jgi:hypothetical protein